MHLTLEKQIRKAERSNLATLKIQVHEPSML